MGLRLTLRWIQTELWMFRCRDCCRPERRRKAALKFKLAKGATISGDGLRRSTHYS